MYKVRLSFDSLEAAVKTLASSNFSGAKPSLVINSTKSFRIGGHQKYRYPLNFKLETYFDGDCSICCFLPLLKCFRDILEYDKLIFIGSYENPCITFKHIGESIALIEENQSLFKLFLVTKEYRDLEKSDKSKGVKSLDVEIEIFINGNLKPYSAIQAMSHNLTLAVEEPTYTNVDLLPNELKFLGYNFIKFDESLGKEYTYI